MPLAALDDALKADGTLTPAARALHRRQHALKLGEDAAKKLDDAKAKVAREIETLQRATAAPPPPKSPLDLQLEGELRARLASMQQGERDKILDIVDDTVAAAILRGHPALAGITATQQTMYREKWRKTRFPAEADRMARLVKGVEAVERAGQALVGYVREIADTVEAKRAEARANRTTKALEATT